MARPTARLTLYQAEWCPFSSAVREVLTELGIDFVARQVEPWPEQRARLVERSGKDEIPALETEDGRFFHGTRAIFGYLQEQEPWEHADGHRRRFLDHRDARESDTPGRLVEYFRASPGPEPEAEPTVVNVPEASRYELRDGERMIGELAYRRRDGRLALIHVEVDEALEGRGLGSALVTTALDDARREGLEVVPLCPFVEWFVEQNPEYQDIVAADYREH
jgi:predicted GNAT family acetyltransferase/glutaredoxin